MMDGAKNRRDAARDAATRDATREKDRPWRGDGIERPKLGFFVIRTRASLRDGSRRVAFDARLYECLHTRDGSDAFRRRVGNRRASLRSNPPEVSGRRQSVSQSPSPRLPERVPVESLHRRRVREAQRRGGVVPEPGRVPPAHHEARVRGRLPQTQSEVKRRLPNISREPPRERGEKPPVVRPRGAPGSARAPETAARRARLEGATGLPVGPVSPSVVGARGGRVSVRKRFAASESAGRISAEAAAPVVVGFGSVLRVKIPLAGFARFVLLRRTASRAERVRGDHDRCAGFLREHGGPVRGGAPRTPRPAAKVVRCTSPPAHPRDEHSHRIRAAQPVVADEHDAPRGEGDEGEVASLSAALTRGVRGDARRGGSERRRREPRRLLGGRLARGALGGRAESRWGAGRRDRARRVGRVRGVERLERERAVFAPHRLVLEATAAEPTPARAVPRRREEEERERRRERRRGEPRLGARQRR